MHAVEWPYFMFEKFDVTTLCDLHVKYCIQV